MFADKFEGGMGTDFGYRVEVIAAEENAKIYELWIMLVLHRSLGQV